MKRQRQASLPGFDLEDYVRESIEFLREHEPPEGYFVGFSGGKDSIVTLELCKMAGVKHEAFYSCTRIDPPEVVRFIREHHPEVKWLYPKMTFLAGIKRKCPPLRINRWCCDVLKKAPADDNPLKHRVMGVRAEESVRRASRPRITSFRNQTTYKPIFHWKEWQIWEFIEKHKLPYPSLYDDGFHRMGCVICPFIMGRSAGAIRQRQESMKRWPGMWKAFEHAVRGWWDAKKDAGDLRNDHGYKDSAEYYQAYLNGFE